MRPRVFPAEDHDEPGELVPADVDASMRPRVFPAEDVSEVGDTGQVAWLQ